MNQPTDLFEAAVMQHLPAAYNLARWLLRDDRQAEDAVQEACLRAFRFFGNLRAENARPWLLGIVRNTCYDWMRQHRHQAGEVEFDEMLDGDTGAATMVQQAPGRGDPAVLWEQRALGMRVNAAIAALPPAFREVVVLREIEGMSYEDIARIAGIPAGTVMSRLSRARALLRDMLQADALTQKPERRPDAAAGR